MAWVLMPDHWHGLVEVGHESLSKTVQRLKVNVARRVNAAERRRGPLWAPAFHDHALRSDEALLDAARYILRNPLRAGLARRVGDYPYWDAVWLDGSGCRGIATHVAPTTAEARAAPAVFVGAT